VPKVRAIHSRLLFGFARFPGRARRRRGANNSPTQFSGLERQAFAQIGDKVGAFEKQQSETGIDGRTVAGIFPTRPVATLLLIGDKNLGTPTIPIVFADCRQTEQHADALHRPQEIQILHRLLAPVSGWRTDVFAQSRQTIADAFVGERLAVSRLAWLASEAVAEAGEDGVGESAACLAIGGGVGGAGGKSLAQTLGEEAGDGGSAAMGGVENLGEQDPQRDGRGKEAVPIANVFGLNRLLDRIGG
jgi:hypothetical protein